jgi:hypothetical protein
MKHGLACLACIQLSRAGTTVAAGHAQERPGFLPGLSRLHIDGSYGSAADCDEAHHNDLNARQGLAQDSRDFLQTEVGRCIATDAPRFAD